MRGGNAFVNTKEEILEFTTKALRELCEFDRILDRFPEEPTFNNISIKHIDIEKIVTKAAILLHFNDSGWLERKLREKTKGEQKK